MCNGPGGEHPSSSHQRRRARRVQCIGPAVVWMAGAVLLTLGSTHAQESSSDAAADTARKQTFERVCGACHDVDTALGGRRTRAEWNATIEAMVSQGARATDEELKQIATYLTTNFGVVNVNKASAEEIEVVLAVAAKQAEEIVRSRGEQGDFTSLESLTRVAGIDASWVEQRKNRIALK
jgi:competence ComEA-like helix-hairpin-helix protein